MYDELVKRLRRCAVYPPEKFSKNAETLDVLIKAADAIEELHEALNGTASNLIRQIAELSKPKWIPVTERLPCLTTPVLVTDGIEVDIAWMYGVPPRWITSYTAIDEDKLTHWMPLPKTPQPPKEE